MRKNFPIIDEEIQIQDNDVLISKTDTKGVITYASPDFARISGFDSSEMVGKAHNIIRHPDMPPSVFLNLWETIHAGKPWTGIVKNRAKNGAFYWVDATVSPIVREGKTSGYISVRRKPTRDEIRAAEKIYKSIEQKRSNMGSLFFTKDFFSKMEALPYRIKIGIVFFWQALPLLLLALTNSEFRSPVYAGLLALYLVWMAPGLLLIRKNAKQCNLVLGNLIEMASGNLQPDSTLSFEEGSMNLIFKSFRTSLWGIMSKVQSISEQLSFLSSGLENSIRFYSDFVETYSKDMEKISLDIRDLSSSNDTVTKTIENEKEAIHYLKGLIENLFGTMQELNSSIHSVNEIAKETKESSNRGQTAMNETTHSMKEISDNSGKIKEFLALIQEIAGRTNLLSLNASIEAARAGEQGKGFTIVASEISKLAEETASNVSNISTLVSTTNRLIQKGNQSVSTTSGILSEISTSIEKLHGFLGKANDQVQVQIEQSEEVERHLEDAAELAVEVDNTAAGQRRTLNAIAEAMQSMNAGTRQITIQVEELQKILKEIQVPIEYMDLLSDYYKLSA